MILSGNTYRELQREVREAATTAITALTEVRNHQATCVEHNKRIEQMLQEARGVNERRHAENQDAIGEVHGRVTNLSGKMNTLIISFLASVVVMLLSAWGAIVAHKLGLL